MRLVSDIEPTVKGWLADHHALDVRQSPSIAYGVIDDVATVVGALVLTFRSDATGEIHVYGRTSNDVWRAFFRQAFVRHRLSRLEARTSTRNAAIQKAAPKFGFQIEGIAPAYYGPGHDAIVYSMQPQQCRWLRGLTV